jgi:hypothetical protein
MSRYSTYTAPLPLINQKINPHIQRRIQLTEWKQELFKFAFGLIQVAISIGFNNK